MPIQHASPVTVSLQDLRDDNVSFATLLQAFGPDSLGILVVKDLPATFSTWRSKVLGHSSTLAALPADQLQRLTNPDAKYLVGWSHGVEALRPGVVDTAKGSYYMNCAFYRNPELEGGDATKFPGFEEYTAPNVWPDIPDFRPDTEALIRVIIDTAVLVARTCDRFAEAQDIKGYESGYLERVVRSSTTTKARLLHYFPADTDNGHGDRNEDDDDVDDSWCTTHLDHGCLTGLTSAMFLDESADRNELPSSPDPSSGLYILSRSGQVFKVGIPRDCLAFQTGEALELITQGKFKAVPHFVKGVDPRRCAPDSRIARNTLAVFTQPDLDEVVDPPTGLTFGEFARGVVRKNTAG